MANFKALGYLLGSALMVVGVLFIAIPDQIVNFLAIVIGAVLLVSGLVRVLTVASSWRYWQHPFLMLLFGIALLGIGIYTIFNTQITVTVIGIILGIFAILMAFDSFASLSERPEGTGALPYIISGLIHLAFGVALIYASMAMLTIIVVLYGIYLLVAGLLILLSSLYFPAY